MALLGHNGAGKSTLIKILSGAYQRESGDILINGEKVDIRSPRDAKDWASRPSTRRLPSPTISMLRPICFSAAS